MTDREFSIIGSLQLIGLLMFSYLSDENKCLDFPPVVCSLAGREEKVLEKLQTADWALQTGGTIMQNNIEA